MPRFAPVAPPHILSKMLDMNSSSFGSYHLWLAHLTIQKEQEFRDLLTKHEELKGFNVLDIIMDNSIVELGSALDAEVMAKAVDIASRGSFTRVIPVLPDVMGDAHNTTKLVEASYVDWVDNVPAPHGFMLVTQGRHWGDFVRLVDHFFIFNRQKYDKINWVGIPRKMVEQQQTRLNAVQYIKTVAPTIKIHLLGFSSNIWDDMRCAREGVEGIDSAVPVRYKGLLTPSTFEHEIGKRGDWMENGEFTWDNVDNIQRVRHWIQQDIW